MNTLPKIVKRFQRIFEKCYLHIQRNQKRYFYLALLVTFLILTIRAYYTPYSDTDDYFFMTVHGLKPVTSISDIITSQVWMWHHWSGRVFTHGVLQLFLFLGKWATASFLPLCYIINACLISKMASKDNHIHYIPTLFVLASMYYMSPTWGDTMAWITGGFNYTVTLTWSLCFLYLFTLSLRGFHESKWFENPITMSLLAMLGSCGNENMSASLVCVCFVLLFVYKKKGILSINHIVSFLFLTFGSGLLLLAPGNYVRVEVIDISAQVGSLYNLCVRAWTFLTIFSEAGLPSLFMLLACFIFTDKNKLKETPIYWFLAIGILAGAAMVAVPQGFPARSYNPCFVMFLICVLICVRCFPSIETWKKQLNSLVCVFFCNFQIINMFYMLFVFIHRNG